MPDYLIRFYIQKCHSFNIFFSSLRYQDRWHALRFRNYKHAHHNKDQVMVCINCSIFGKHKKNSYQVEHSVRMSCELGHLGEWWVFPHQDLVLGVAVCADLVDINGESQNRKSIWFDCESRCLSYQLVGVFGPGQVADLWAGVGTL